MKINKILIKSKDVILFSSLIWWYVFYKRVDRIKQSDGSYKCNNCGEVFSGMKADGHIVAAHIVEKCKRAEKYQCPVCNKCFSSKSNLEQHKKIIHYDGPMNVLSWEEAKKSWKPICLKHKVWHTYISDIYNSCFGGNDNSNKIIH